MIWIVGLGWVLRALGAGLPILGVLRTYRRAKSRADVLARTELPLNDPHSLHMGYMDFVMPGLVDEIREGPQRIFRDVLLIVVGLVLGFVGDILLAIV